MTPKPYQVNSKTSNQRPVRKSTKGATETGRLFIDVNDAIRRTQTMPLTRYVEWFRLAVIVPRFSPGDDAGSVASKTFAGIFRSRIKKRVVILSGGETCGCFDRSI